MITHDFDYCRASTVQEAVDLLAERKAAARVLAGGTDLLLRIADGFETPSVLLDIKGVPELSAVRRAGGSLLIGATATFSEILRSPEVREHLPVLWEAARCVGSVGIRNRATLAGNLCSAVPSLDGGPPLLVYEASVSVRGPRGERLIPIGEWFKGPRATALGEDELVTGVQIPIPPPGTAGCFVRLGRYRGEDCAQVGVAVLALADGGFRVAFCAVGPVPRRAPLVEKALQGRIDDGALDRAAELVARETSPITDHRATKEYRLHMSRLMLRRAVKAAAARRDGGGPDYGAELL